MGDFTFPKDSVLAGVFYFVGHIAFVVSLAILPLSHRITLLTKDDGPNPDGRTNDTRPRRRPDDARFARLLG